MSGKFVTLRAPDGRELQVPEENAGRALEAGYQAVEAEAAAPAEPEPAAAPVEASFVSMRAPDGRMLQVPQERAQEAQQAGYEPAEPGEGDGFLGGSESSLGEKAITAAEGVGRGLALGATSPLAALQALGENIGHQWFEAINPEAYQTGGGDFGAQFDRAVADIHERANRNPLSNIGGQAVGIIAPALATGGAAAAPAVAKSGLEAFGRRVLANTPAGLVGRVGAKAAAKVAERVLPSAARGLARPAAGLLARGATEGAAIGAASEVDNMIQAGNWDGVAEKVLIGAAKGAGTGAVTSLLVGGTLGILGRAKRAIASSRLGTAARDWIEEADNAVGVENVAPEAAQELRGPLASTELTPTGKRLSQLARGAGKGFEKVQQSATRSIEGDLNQYLKLQDAIDETGGIAAKRAASQAFDELGQPFKQGMDQVRELTTSIRERVDGLLQSEIRKEALKTGGGYTAISRVSDMLEAVDNEVQQSLARGDAGQAYMALDQGLKKVIGQAATARNPIASQVFRTEYGRVQRFLEDESIWGELAKRQKAVNPSWTERIRRGQDQRVKKFFLESGEAAENPFERLPESNGASIGGLLRGLGDAETQGEEMALRRLLRSGAWDAQARAKAWGSPELQAQALQMRKLAEKIEAAMDDVAAVRRGQKDWQAVDNAVKGIPFAESTVKAAGTLMQKAAQVGPAATSAGDAAAGIAARAQRKLNGHVAMRRLLEADPDGPARVARQILTHDQVDKMVASVDDDSEQEMALRDSIDAIDDDSPELAAAIRRQNELRKAFIRSKMGPIADPSLLGGKKQRDPVTQEKLGRYIEAADHPRAAWKRIADGSASPEDVETLQTLFPQAYDEFRTKVAAELARRGDGVSFEARNRLTLMLQLPVDDTHSAQHTAWLQQVAITGSLANAQQPPSSRRQLKGPASSLTRAQRTDQ